MSAARFVSLQLVRFDTPRQNEGWTEERPPALFAAIGADTRAAGTEPASQQAYAFVLFGLHENEAEASAYLEERERIAPWTREAKEVYGAVLQPVRHRGEANYLRPEEPGALYEELGEAEPGGPVVVMTTAGYKVGEGLDMERVRQFANGVAAVRISMTAVDGLHSQQSFFFPGVLATDPMTVTFWRDEAAVRNFSYGPGVHKAQMERYWAENLADRTSFTRGRVRRSVGTWYGKDPQAWS